MMNSLLVVLLVLLGIYGKVVLSQTDGVSTVDVSTDSDYNPDYPDYPIDYYYYYGSNDTDPLKAQCRTLLRQYVGYAVGNLTYKTSGCQMYCYGIQSNTDDYYDDSYPESGIINVDIAYEIDASIKNMQECGANMVCYQGECMEVLQEFQEMCQSNTGQDTALQGANECSISCINKIETGDEPETGIEPLTPSQIYMPDRYPCGDGRMCSDGICLPADLFPKCTT